MDKPRSRTECLIQDFAPQNPNKPPKPPQNPRRLPRLRMALVADAWALLGRSCLLARYSIAFILPTPNACRRGLVRSVRVRVHGRRRSRDPRTRTSHGLGLVRVRVWHCQRAYPSSSTLLDGLVPQHRFRKRNGFVSVVQDQDCHSKMDHEWLDCGQ